MHKSCCMPEIQSLRCSEVYCFFYNKYTDDVSVLDLSSLLLAHCLGLLTETIAELPTKLFLLDLKIIVHSKCLALGEVESMIKFQQEFDTKTLIYDTTSTIIAYQAMTVTLGSLLKVFKS